MDRYHQVRLLQEDKKDPVIGLPDSMWGVWCNDDSASNGNESDELDESVSRKSLGNNDYDEAVMTDV